MSVRSLDERLPAAAPWLLCLSALLAVALASLLQRLGAPYGSLAANLALQLPHDLAGFTSTLQLWNADPVRLARYQQLDWLLPPAYAVATALLAGLLARIHRDAGRAGLAPPGIVLSHALLLCIPLDWLENHYLAAALAAPQSDAARFYVETARHLSAEPKWLLLSAFAAWTLFALLGLLAGRRQRHG